MVEDDDRALNRVLCGNILIWLVVTNVVESFEGIKENR